MGGGGGGTFSFARIPWCGVRWGKMSSVWVGKQHVKCLNGLLFAFRLVTWGCVGTSWSIFHGGIPITHFILHNFCPYIAFSVCSVSTGVKAGRREQF